MSEACIAFKIEDPAEAWKHLRNSEIIRNYGGEAYGHRLHTWDDGDRQLCRCKTCGGLFLRQSSEFHGMEDDDYYTDWFPVSSAEEADMLNRKYDGFAIEREFPGRYLMETNLRLSWSRPGKKKEETSDQPIELKTEEAPKPIAPLQNDDSKGDDGFKPEDNLPPLLYGPPPFERDPVIYPVEENIPPTVYGPPKFGLGKLGAGLLEGLQSIFSSKKQPSEQPGSMHSIVGWRISATGVSQYKFFDREGKKKICSVSGIVIPNPPVTISSEGFRWTSRYENQETIHQGSFRMVSSEDGSTALWKLVYLDKGKYEIICLSDGTKTGVQYNDFMNNYRFMKDGNLVAVLGRVPDPAIRLKEYDNSRPKEIDPDAEPFFEGKYQEGISAGWLAVMLAFPSLRFGY